MAAQILDFETTRQAHCVHMYSLVLVSRINTFLESLRSYESKHLVSVSTKLYMAAILDFQNGCNQKHFSQYLKI